MSLSPWLLKGSLCFLGKGINLPTVVNDADRRGPPRVPARRKQWAFRLLAATVLPALFFLSVEAGLRLLGYGYPTEFLQPVEGQRAYTSNPKFGRRFFSPSLSRQPHDLTHLPANKGPATFRIFVVGGSAAYGVPCTSFSFSHILEVMLRDTYPNVRFEVVNAAITATNSHVALQVTRDCCRHDADLIVVYMGHNEVVGPYGPGTVFKSFSPSLTAIRCSLWLKKTRTGQLLESVSRWSERKSKRSEWGGMKMFLGNQIAHDDPRLQTTREHFRKNLSDLCAVAKQHGAQTIVCTVATNQKDCPPFASLQRAGLTQQDKQIWNVAYKAGIELENQQSYEAALAQYLEAERIDGHHAELRFRQAVCHQKLARFREAKRLYGLACDLDALRFRADSHINRIIRETACDREVDGVFLVDAERALEDSLPISPGILGEEFLWEHVHLNVAGNCLLARAVFETVNKLLPPSIVADAEATREPPSLSRCPQLLAMCTWNQLRLLWEIEKLTDKPPFINQLGHELRHHRMTQQIQHLRSQMTDANLAQAEQLYSGAITQAPDDLEFRIVYCQLLLQLDKPAKAAEQIEFMISKLPGNSRLQKKLEIIQQYQRDR